MTRHTPVLLDEALQWLDVRPGGVYVDGTLGLGGHSHEILKRLEGTGRLIGLDRDPEALVRAQERLSWSRDNTRLLQEDYRNLPQLLAREGLEGIDGLLLDLGVSSIQLDTPSRGFSFRLDGPIDMRFDPRQSLTAADILNSWPASDLVRIFREFGEEPSARRWADAIVSERNARPFRSTTRLAELAEELAGNRPKRRIHPATRIFQALRIAVNRELNGLSDLLKTLPSLLNPEGRLVAISFHSLEDRLIKRTLQEASGACICRRPGHLCTCPRIHYLKVLTRKPVQASEAETAKNPRARSAKLRAAERTLVRLTQERRRTDDPVKRPNTTRQRRFSSRRRLSAMDATRVGRSSLRIFADIRQDSRLDRPVPAIYGGQIGRSS